MKCLVHFDRRRKLLDGLNSIEGINCLRAQGAFYLFLNISSFGIPSEEFSGRFYLISKKVAVVSGHAFGADGYIRLSGVTSDQIIKKGSKRIKFFCDNLHEDCHFFWLRYWNSD